MNAFKEEINAVIDYWDGSPDSDPALAYDCYWQDHTNEYMHMVNGDPENNIDYDNGTITIDGQTYTEKNMYLLHEKDHIYLFFKDNKILIEWLDYYIGKPYALIP